MFRTLVAPVIPSAATAAPATVIPVASVIAVVHTLDPIGRRQHDGAAGVVRCVRPVAVAAGFVEDPETVPLARAERNDEVRLDRHHAAVAIIAVMGKTGAGSGQHGACNQQSA